MKITILGKGAWGKALGEILIGRSHAITWLEKGSGRIPPETEMLWIALPTQSIRDCMKTLQPRLPHVPVVSLSKGIEIGTGLRVSEIVSSFLPQSPFAAVSGPSLAVEVRKKIPTALVAASTNGELVAMVQKILHGSHMRVYRSTDLVGVEWGGALKNVYALAAGMCAGLGLGENSLAGLTTRSLREMTRVAVHFGAQTQTLQGLSGIGDLILTSYSRLSRNRRVGERIGLGDSVTQALASVEGVCEGVPTAQALHEILVSRNVEAPIAHELYQVLVNDKSPKDSLTALLDRDSKAEIE